MIEFEYEETARFVAQNEDFVRGLTDDELATVDLHSSWHGGDLYVLWRDLEDGLMVKAHESWGGEDEHGNLHVVHYYDADGLVDRVDFHPTGREALDAFLKAEASDVRRSYVVGLPVVVTVTYPGTVTYEVDTGDAGSVVREEYPFPDDTVDLTEEQVEADAALIDADHDRRHGR